MAKAYTTLHDARREVILNNLLAAKPMVLVGGQGVGKTTVFNDALYNAKKIRTQSRRWIPEVCDSGCTKRFKTLLYQGKPAVYETNTILSRPFTRWCIENGVTIIFF